METSTRSQGKLSASPELTGTLPAGQWGIDPFRASSSEDQHVISAELWRAWEEKSRLRGRVNTRKIIVGASAGLLALWLAGMITSYTWGGSIHILLLIAMVALAFTRFWSAGRFRN